jgi:hypothetical protein
MAEKLRLWFPLLGKFESLYNKHTHFDTQFHQEKDLKQSYKVINNLCFNYLQ